MHKSTQQGKKQDEMLRENNATRLKTHWAKEGIESHRSQATKQFISQLSRLRSSLTATKFNILSNKQLVILSTAAQVVDK